MDTSPDSSSTIKESSFATMTATTPPQQTQDEPEEQEHPAHYTTFNNMSIVSPAVTPDPVKLTTEILPDNNTSSSSTPVNGLTELPRVFCESRARIPTTSGAEIYLHLYKNDVDDKEHLAIVFGQDIKSDTLFAPRANETEEDRMTRGAYEGKLYPGRKTSRLENTPAEEKKEEDVNSNNAQDTLVRIHSECYTGETAWSARCDCGEQLDEAARLMASEGKGVIVYLRQEGRGIGLSEKLKAYNLQDLGADTVTANLMLRHPADARSFGLATAILKDLEQTRIRLLTNNPDKISAVEGKHKEIKVTQRVPMVPLSWQDKGGFKSKEVELYLQTKIDRMGHLLNRA